MSNPTLSDASLKDFAADIASIPPRPHHAALLKRANLIQPGCDFKLVLNRGGWYRPGGVIAAGGQRIADSLDLWAQAELAACDGDLDELLEKYDDQGLLVTRHTGRTLYYVASYGPAPADFLQLEVEELQEVLDRNLIDPDSPPADLQELTEPISPVLLDAQPVAAPRYQFRRLINIRQEIARANATSGRNVELSRIFSEWSHSSAAMRGHFSDHWVIGLREHLDRYRNPATSISLISRHSRELKPFQWNDTLSGVELAAQLQAFDRAAGYTAAWYFHLVTGAFTPPKIAYAVARDLEAGFSYLPDTEAALVKGWVEAPYSV